MLKLEIPENIYSYMLEQARIAEPVEACGILAGTGCAIDTFYKMTNADNSPIHFSMIAEEQFGVIKDMRGKGSEMLAIYHSHPATPARVSAEDIRLALTPNVAYVILSLQDAKRPCMKGFVVVDGVSSEIPIEIISTCAGQTIDFSTATEVAQSPKADTNQ